MAVSAGAMTLLKVALKRLDLGGGVEFCSGVGSRVRDSLVKANDGSFCKSNSFVAGEGFELSYC
jgi:hypothetical protein